MPIQTDAAQDRAPGVTPTAPWRVTAVSPLPGHRLAVTFRDGRGATLDCSALLTAKDAGIFAALSEPALFERVGVELGVITWPNGADLDPAWIYEETRGRKTWSVPF